MMTETNFFRGCGHRRFWVSMGMWMLWTVWLLASACGGGGVSGQTDGDADDPQCRNNDDCAPGFVCNTETGACVAGADGDVDPVETEVEEEAKITGSMTCPETVDFGAVSIGRQMERDVVLSNGGLGTLTIVEATLDRETGTEFVIVSGPAANETVAPGMSVTVKVRYTPVDEGEDTGLLVVYTDDPETPVCNVQLTTSYKGNARLEADPESLDFGMARMGTVTDEKCITLSDIVDADGNRVVAIASIYIASRTNTVFELVDPPQGRTLVSPAQPLEQCVVFHPPSVGEYDDAVLVDADDRSEPLRIPLAGLGGSGTVSASPSELDFGAVPLNNGKDMILRITNTGQYPLTIDSLATGSPAPFTVAATSPSVAVDEPWVVASSDVLTVTMRFTPVDDGEAVGSLRIESDDPLNPVVQVRLEGVGQKPAMVVDPVQVDFQNVQVNNAAGQDVSFRRGDDFDASLTVTAIAWEEVTLNGQAWEGDAPFSLETPGLLPLSLDDGEAHSLRFIFHAVAEGRFEARAAVTTTPGVFPRPVISVTGTGVATHFVSEPAEGTPLDFGDVRIGEAVQQDLAVTNSGNMPLDISGISLAADGYDGFSVTSPETTSMQVLGGASRVITLRADLTGETVSGEKTGVLFFSTNDLEHVEVIFDLQCRAIDPAMSIEPPHTPNFTMENQPLGGAGTWQMFTISNSGTLGDLEIGGIGFSGDTDSGFELGGLDDVTFPVRLAPFADNGETLSFRVRYTSHDLGSFWGYVDIDSNDLGSEHYTISLLARVNQCPAEQALCDAACVEAFTLDHCLGVDGCGPCPQYAVEETHGDGYCAETESGAGQCAMQCEYPWDDCNEAMADGCETDITASALHCSACDSPCTAPSNATALCSDSQCDFVCNEGFCRVGDGCVADGAVDPENECLACNWAVQPLGYSPRSPGAACGDQSVSDCSAPDACDGQGVCVPNHANPGTVCEDDDNECTGDICDGEGLCVHPNIVAACNDDDACTHSDTCVDGQCIGSSYVCDDDNLCTDNVCNGDGTCSYPDNTLPCNDDNACTHSDTCGGGSCNGTAYTCGDGNECTDDVCNGDGTCSYPAREGTCNDGNACTFNDICTEGHCGGEAYACDDDNPCTDNVCNGDGTCGYPDNTLPCNDGNACTHSDTCGGGSCNGTAYTCGDGNECTDDICNGDGTCSYPSREGSCNDGDACTFNDVCTGGHCGGEAYVCNDDDICTDDVCNGDGTCGHPYNTAACNDNQSCTYNDRCSEGVCTGSVYQCNDDNECTDNVCNGDGTCAYPYNTDPCDDGDACSSGDVCRFGQCVGESYTCEDDNECTDNVCNGDGTCSYPDNTAACDDGDPCTFGDVCGAGTCGGTSYDCGDGNLCTDDVCNGDGTCAHPFNNDPCTLPNASASCSAGSCGLDSCLTGYDSCDGNNLNGCEVNHTVVGGGTGIGDTCANAVTMADAEDIENLYICGDIGSDITFTHSARNTYWFRLVGEECDMWDSERYLDFHFYLNVPAGVNYTISVYDECGDSPSASATNGNVCVWWYDNVWDPFGNGFDYEDNSDDMYIKVEFSGGNSCDSFTLYVEGNDGNSGCGYL